MKTKGLLLASLTCVFLSAVAITAASNPKEHGIKVGKKGEITLTQATKAKDRMLEPGTYVVQHRESHGDHFVRFLKFTVLDYSMADTGSSDTYTVEDNAGEIKCRVESASGPIKQTTVYTVTENGTERITKVAIRGENVVHIF
jgi:hypothetical protein